MSHREVVYEKDSTRDSSGKRFKPNRIVRAIIDRKMYPDLNNIWAAFCRGDYSTEEMKEFYQLIGYSLYGYWEIFCFNNDDENSRGWTPADEALMNIHLWGQTKNETTRK